MSDSGLEVVCEMNQHGTCTWVSTDKILTEFDPFYICAYGYQDQTNESGEKHFVWMTLSGASSSLSRVYGTRAEAMKLIDRIRQVKKVN